MKWIKRIALVVLVALGAIGLYNIYSFFYDRVPKKEVKATVLLDRIEKVVKIVTVEGNFSEIYDYKHHFIADIWPFRKKALVRIKAKVLVGYDFEKVKIVTDEKTRTIRISNIPDPEILSIEHDMDYYNFENGLFNMITNKDITEMGFEAKDFIAKQAIESDLFVQAEKQRRELFELLELAIQNSGWTLEINEHSSVISG